MIRYCAECFMPVISGYHEGRDFDYCSEVCLHHHFTDAEWKAACEKHPTEFYWADYTDDTIGTRVLAYPGESEKPVYGTITEVLCDGEPDLFAIDFDDGTDEIMTPNEFEEVDEMYHIYIFNGSLRQYFTSSPDFEKAKKIAAEYANTHDVLTEVYDVGCYPHSVTLSICPKGTEAPLQWEITEYDTPIPAWKAFDNLPCGIDVAVYYYDGTLLCSDYGSTYKEPYDWSAVDHVEVNAEENFARIYLTGREIDHE